MVAVAVGACGIVEQATPTVPPSLAAAPSGGPSAGPSGAPAPLPPGRELYGFVPYWEMDAGIADHLASTPLSKYDLLKNLTERLQRRDIDLHPQDQFVCDRSLDPTALVARVKYRVPSWNVMLDELAASILKRDRQS